MFYPLTSINSITMLYEYISGSRWTTGLAEHQEFVFFHSGIFGTLTFLKVFGLKQFEVITQHLRGINRISTLGQMAFGLRLKWWTFQDTTTIPEKGHPAMLQIQGSIYAPTTVIVCFPILSVTNLLTHAAKVVIGLSLEIGRSFRLLFSSCQEAFQWTVSTWRHTPTSSLDNTEDPESVNVSLKLRKPGEVIITISYGKFKVNRPIVGLSLISKKGIFSDLYITGYTRLSILYDSASPLSYLRSQNGANPISVSITSYKCLSQILKQRQI